MVNYPYSEVRLSELSKIAHSFHIVTSSGGRVADALIIKFVGSYGVGCKGNDDACYMRAVASAGLEAWRPGVLVFDFSELDYVWGDMLDSVLSVGKGKVSALEMLINGKISDISDLKPSDIPTIVVVSDRCRKAVRSLLVEEMSENPEKWMFDSLQAAISAIPKQ
jgi:hypothetical protein